MAKWLYSFHEVTFFCNFESFLETFFFLHLHVAIQDHMMSSLQVKIVCSVWMEKDTNILK